VTLHLTVTTSNYFLTPDGKSKRAVHVQRSNRGAPYRCQTDEIFTVPTEVNVPNVPPRMKNRDEFAGFRI
jgi:hypothetical protein